MTDEHDRPTAPGDGAQAPGQELALTGDSAAARAAGPLGPGEAEAVEQELGVYRAPNVGPADLAALPAPFTGRQLARIDEALTLSSRETGLLFSVYVGAMAEPTRPAAESLAARIPAKPGVGIVLIALSPGQRVLEVVTARGATKRLTNRVCALAALGMNAAFAGGDLTAGIVNGLRMLADAAGSDTASTNHP